MTDPYRPVPLVFDAVGPEDALVASATFRARMATRRTVRTFADTPVPWQLVEDALATAATAPSGAHQQPWTFVVVTDPDVRARIREAAEAEEREAYAGRLGPQWLAALAPLGTDAVKAHLTDAPWLVVVFAHHHGVAADGSTVKHYYVRESVGIACGLMLASLHLAGLAALTHTPSPMGFLGEILGRPSHERAYLVVPVGYPAPGTVVPDLTRKGLGDVVVRV